MCRAFLKLMFLAPLLCIAADPVPPERTPLQVGSNVPGSSNPYNVTGSHAGKYHSLVTEHGLEPGILVFVRNFDTPEALAAVKPLLSVIDDRIDKNFTRVRLNCYVVFFSDELTDVVGVAGSAEANAKNDDLREAYDKKLKDLANSDPKLKYVILTLDDANDLKKFGLDESKFITVVLFKKLQIVAAPSLTKDEITEKKIGEISDDITDKLGATRK